MNTPQSKSPIPNITNKLINPSSSSSSNSPAINDSPIFNYISNLSPIQPVKAEPGAQGFPGLASPPLLFTSLRINSLQSLLNRKLQSSGSWESPLDKDKHHQTGGDPEKPARIDPEYNIPFLSGEQRPCSVKNLGQISHCSPGCIDDFLSDPDANSSCKRQSDDVSQSTGGGSLQIRDGRSCENLNLRGSTPLRVRKGGHAKSRISIKVVKNEARHLMPSSEGSGSVPRLLTEHAFEICQNGDSLNEASHIERGTLRRCLFEENQRKCSNRSEFRNFSDNLNRMEELTKLSSVGVLGARPDSGTINNPKPPTGSCASPVTGSYPSISKPLGIGLHLNSVVYPRTLDSSSGSQQSSLAGFEGKNPVLTSNRSEGGVTVTILGNASEEGQQDKVYHTASLGEAKPSDIEHFYGPDLLKLDAHSASMCVKRKFSPQTAEYDEMPNQMSPKKKRKKSSNSDNDIPKRCNCKKTKCLKLYCDCFAAGMYCSESCACQGCCNRPENEGTVHETRQQIESRNPLAFAPKVVKLVTDPPAINKEVQNLSTPSSARHKTGCNCKKSMCLKKYCECYQANVGCSEGCRCEGCKNVFGVREDYRINRAGSMVRNAADEISEAKADRKHTSPNLTPATPALLCSDLRKNAIKSRLPYMRFLPSPDSPNDVSISDENFLTCPENTQAYTMFLENGSECIDEVAYHADDLEDRLETTADMSITTSALRSDSVSTLMGPPSSSKTMSSSLRWRSSPITPINLSAGVKFQDPSSGGKNPDMIDDETPDVLRDSPTTNKSVKVSSPNKKRISAPQNPIDSSLQNLADSSGSLKVCHRFVLRALPTFPSLTPVSKKQQ